MQLLQVLESVQEEQEYGQFMQVEEPESKYCLAEQQEQPCSSKRSAVRTIKR